MEKVAIETEEDYQKIISKLKEFDVEVVRTDVSDNVEDYCNAEGVVVEPPPMCPRDFTAMVGNNFYMPGKHYAQNFNVDEKISTLSNEFNWSSNSWISKYGFENAKSPSLAKHSTHSLYDSTSGFATGSLRDARKHINISDFVSRAGLKLKLFEMSSSSLKEIAIVRFSPGSQNGF